MARFPILNGLLQSDLDANHHKIINLDGLGNVQTGMVYVDPEAADGVGIIGTSSAFNSLAEAIDSAPEGYTILLRPAIHQFDGQIEVSRKVQIIGYGATIAPLTLGVSCGLRVTGGGTQIHGITFAGGISSPVDVDTGSIAIAAPDVYIRDVVIAEQHGVGIELESLYDGVVIETSYISECFKGITGGIDATSIASITIRDCDISLNREEGILLTGIDNTGGVALRNVRIEGNNLNTNNTTNTNKSGIYISAGAIDVIISGNYVHGTHYNGIIGVKILRGNISDNNVTNAINNLIQLLGHQKCNITGNLSNGAAANGTPQSVGGVFLSGDYAIANDSGPTLIASNQITGIHSSGFPMLVFTTNNTTIEANQLQRIYAVDYTDLAIIGNDINVDGTSPGIFLDTLVRGNAGAAILANKFSVTGTPSRLIATKDTGALGNDNIHINANSSTSGKTYSDGIFDNISGSLPTNVYKSGNTPPSESDNNEGWVNDDESIALNQVFVSHQHGNNNNAIRESKAHPYFTLAAAITAAESGDEVIVLDGIFNERVAAKDGITLRFLPQATLVCSSASGCIISTADGETFSFFHEHTPIVNSQAGTRAVVITDAGTYHLYADITNTGTNTGTISDAVEIADNSTVNLNSKFIYSAHGLGIQLSPAGTPTVTVAPGCTVSADEQLAAGVTSGTLIASNVNFVSGAEAAVSVSTAAGNVKLRQCSLFTGGAAKPAMIITATSTTQDPILRDIILISDDTATSSMLTSAAQDVVIMGSVIANKGADPPANVTFKGGGTYVVDADAVFDA